jgi:hypothetical protein
MPKDHPKSLVVLESSVPPGAIVSCPSWSIERVGIDPVVVVAAVGAGGYVGEATTVSSGSAADDSATADLWLRPVAMTESCEIDALDEKVIERKYLTHYA